MKNTTIKTIPTYFKALHDKNYFTYRETKSTLVNLEKLTFLILHVTKVCHQLYYLRLDISISVEIRFDFYLPLFQNISKIVMMLLNLLCTLSYHFRDIKWCRTFLVESRDPFSLQGTHGLQVQTSSKYAVLKHQVKEAVSSKVGQS